MIMTDNDDDDDGGGDGGDDDDDDDNDNVRWMDDDVVAVLTSKIIQPRPNTYTFTKAIAEHLLLEQSGSVPVVIVRPSIVGASWQEPIQVWNETGSGESIMDN